MTLLTVCMPSHRNLEGSRRSIESALAFCETRGADLIISDNSGDPRKVAEWNGCSPRLTYIVLPDDTTAEENFMSSVLPAQTPFILQMGDDDELHVNEAITPLDLATLPEDFVGVHPLTQVWSPTKGVLRAKEFAISDPSAGTRIMEYNHHAGGDNAAFYSIFRRDVYTKMMAFFLEHHPTRGGYCDWAKMLSLVAYGRMASDPATIFRYNIDKWTTKEQIDSNVVDLFKDAGLPADGSKYHYLLMFLDIFVFMARRGSPLSAAEALNAMNVVSGPIFSAFIEKTKTEAHNYSETMRYLADLAQEQRDGDGDARFHIALMMADIVQPGLKDRYITYFKAALAA